MDGDGPFVVVDALGELSDCALAELNDLDLDSAELALTLRRYFDVPEVGPVAGSMKKVFACAPSVLTGIAVCAAFNSTSELVGNHFANR